MGEQQPFVVLAMGGDGIGPEVTAQALRVLRRIADLENLRVAIEEFDVGERALMAFGHALPPEAAVRVDELRGSDHAAILFGAATDEPIGILRQRCDLFANLRPIRPVPELGISALQPHRIAQTDILIVRELVSGIYYGEARQGLEHGVRWASQELRYTEDEIRRVALVALECARNRRKKLTLVHKRNVIKGVFDLWFDVLYSEAERFPDVTIDEVLVDTAAMQMLLQPSQFDVMLCDNMFGDILSDVGAGVVGSIGLLPSASFNSARFSLYEPIGGTAPQLAGRNLANPSASILCVAMLLEHSFKLPVPAARLNDAVVRTLAGVSTADLERPNIRTVTTDEFTDAVLGLYEKLTIATLQECGDAA